MPEEAAPRCARCGLEFGDGPSQCGDFTGSTSEQTALERMDDRVACRDREIGNLRALLRGSTRQLEKVVQTLTDLLEVWS